MGLDNNNSKLDIKEISRKLVSKQALSEENKTRSIKIGDKLKQIFADFDDTKIELLESKGINVRNLLATDLDRVYTDKAYHKAFLDDFSSVLGELDGFLRRESGDL